MTDDLKQKILDLCKDRPYMSFVELTRNIPETNGDFSFGFKTDRGTFYFWIGLSEECRDLLHSMMEAEEIHFQPASTMVYVIDGGMLDIPIPKTNPRVGGTKEWWTPVTINLGKGKERGRKKKHAA